MRYLLFVFSLAVIGIKSRAEDQSINYREYLKENSKHPALTTKISSPQIAFVEIKRAVILDDLQKDSREAPKKDTSESQEDNQ